ncbi:MAG: PrgI family protein [Candidatus Kerfeldbacteria bacterium]|nr:PrgI family protein [Candidatus Kerfeldbacteria bacterium]
MANQYIVPQFIDVEDKILGPISVRQFIIILGGMGLIVGAYQILFRLANQLYAFIFTAFSLFVAMIVFAFVRVNGRPFHLFMLNVLQTLRNPSLRVWNNQLGERLEYRHEPPPPPPIPTKQAMTETKLAQLALLVDTGGAYHEDEELLYWGQSLPGSRAEPPAPAV